MRLNKLQQKLFSSLFKGAQVPLFLVYGKRILITLLICLGVSACSLDKPHYLYYSTGYLSDNDKISIWRQDSTLNGPVKMQVNYESIVGQDNQGEPQRKERYIYRFQHGKLISIQKDDLGDNPEKISLRFDEQGQVIFMEQQKNNRNQALSPEQRQSLQQLAEKLINVSSLLIQNKMTLQYGFYEKGKFFDCFGKRIDVNLSPTQNNLLQNQSGKISISWLSSPSRFWGVEVSSDDVLFSWQKEDQCQLNPAWYKVQ